MFIKIAKLGKPLMESQRGHAFDLAVRDIEVEYPTARPAYSSAFLVASFSLPCFPAQFRTLKLFDFATESARDWGRTYHILP